MRHMSSMNLLALSTIMSTSGNTAVAAGLLAVAMYLLVTAALNAKVTVPMRGR